MPAWGAWGTCSVGKVLTAASWRTSVWILCTHTQDKCCGCICNPSPAGVETGGPRGSVASQSNQNGFKLSERSCLKSNVEKQWKNTSDSDLYPASAPMHHHHRCPTSGMCAHAQNSDAASEKPKPDLKICGKQTWVFTSKHHCLSNAVNNNNKTCFLTPYFPSSLNKNQ